IVSIASAECWSTWTVVNDNNLAAIRENTRATEQESVIVDGRHDGIAVRPDHERGVLFASPLCAHVPSPIAEAIDLVVTNDCLPTLADDGAVRLVDNRSAFLG